MDKTLGIRFTVPSWYTVDDVVKDFDKAIPSWHGRHPFQLIAIDTKCSQSYCFTVFHSIYCMTEYLEYITNTNLIHSHTIIPQNFSWNKIKLDNICTNSKLDNIRLMSTSAYSIHDSDSNIIYLSTIISHTNQEILIKIRNKTATISPSGNGDGVVINLEKPSDLYTYTTAHLNDIIKQDKKLYVPPSSAFYSPSTAWDMTDTNAPLHLLSPLFAVRKSLNAALMFTNKMCIHYSKPIANLKQICDEWNGDVIDIDVDNHSNSTVIKNESVELKYTDLDWNALFEDIKDTFVWLSKSKYGMPMTFPFLALLFDFKNPSCFCDGIKEFSDEVHCLLDEGTMNWVMERVIMSMTNMNVKELHERVERMEDKSDAGGFDIDDENGMAPLVYDIELHKMQMVVQEADSDIVEHHDWKAMYKVSTFNYLVSFCDGFNEFSDEMQQRMITNGFLLTDDKRNELMMMLKGSDCIQQYGACTLMNPLSDQNFIKYWKKTKTSSDTVDINQNSSRYIIYEPQQPPLKKQKIIMKQEPIQNVKPTQVVERSDSSDEEMIMPRVQSPLNRIPKHGAAVRQTKAITHVYTNNEDEPIVTSHHNMQNKIQTPIANQIQTVQTPHTSVPSDNDDDNAPIVSIPIVSNINSDHVLPRSFSAHASNIVKTESSFGVTILSEENRPLRKRKRKPKLKPMSFTETISTDNNCTTQEAKILSSVNTDAKHCNLTIDSNGVGWAFGVPIYHEWYFDCADFKGIEMKDFAFLVRIFAAKTDLEIVKDLRQIGASSGPRRRTVKKPDEAPCQFLKEVYSAEYRSLFVECFTVDDDALMDFDLREWTQHDILQKRGRRAYVIYQSSYGIKECMKERLYLLLKIYHKYSSCGCVHVDQMSPPWVRKMECIVDSITSKFTAIDLTGTEDMDEDEDDDLHAHTGYMKKYGNGIVDYDNVRVKME
eukprot:953783_1